MTNTQEDLGFLLDQRKTLVLSLPTGTKSIVVKYDGMIRVSCVMPPAKRTIQVSGCGKTEVKCPELLFCSDYVDIPMYGKPGVVGAHSIFVINPEVKNKIEACPYFISNVYATGNICFGGMFQPYTPREGFNVFWQSPFNGELRGEEGTAGLDLCAEDTDDYIDEYHKEGIDDQNWQDYTEHVCGQKFWASPVGADGVIITSCNRLLKKIPYKYWRRNHQGYPMIIALANQKDNHWEFTSGNFKFCLDKGFVTNNPKYSPEVSNLKQRFGREKNISKPLI
jgi:hypothetical protein